MTTLRSLLVRTTALAALLSGCGAPSTMDARGVVSFATPQALLSCAAAPADLAARLWVSGSRTPCPLTVDVVAGTTTGSCDVRPGLVRRLTVEWFVSLDRGGTIVDVVVAQASRDLDLKHPVSADAELTLGEDDVRTSECLDLRADAFTGSPTVLVGVTAVPVCDLDDSCARGDGVSCSNLAELCAGTDPLDANEEPAPAAQ